MSYQPQASPADVEWVDTHGDALVSGYMVTIANVHSHEKAGDRRINGRLTRDAKERIASELSDYLLKMHRVRLAANGPGAARPVIYRDCDG